MLDKNNPNSSLNTTEVTIKELLEDNGTIRSIDSLIDVFTFCLNYPFQFIPVVDGKKFSGVIDRDKLKKLEKGQVLQLCVEDMKEDSPFTALIKTSSEDLLKEMNEKKIESVVIINEEFDFQGTVDIFSATTHLVKTTLFKS